MAFLNVDDAIRALEDMAAGPEIHREAILFLAGLDECFKAEGLVQALQNDNFGVRWEAANLIARIGRDAIPAILKALMDPNRVGDSRLRKGIVHAIHNFQDPVLQIEVAPLVKALKGTTPDLDAMREAYLLLNNIDPTPCKENIPIE